MNDLTPLIQLTLGVPTMNILPTKLYTANVHHTRVFNQLSRYQIVGLNDAKGIDVAQCIWP